MPELIFATANRSKLAQMGYVLRALSSPFALIPARERYGQRAAYEEQGGTAAQIAEQGAGEVSARLGVPVLVEDTTFHVAALGGRPGVLARRYLEAHGRQGLLAEMKGRSVRSAQIISAAAWAAPDGRSRLWVTIRSGSIAPEEAWEEGLPEWIAPTEDNPFGGGYNAIFIPRGQARTLAQIPPDEGLTLGYREPNFRAALRFLHTQAAESQSGTGF